MFAGTCQAKGNRASETLGKSLKRQTMVCVLAELAYGMLSPLTEFFQLSSAYGGNDASSDSHIQPELLGPLQPHPLRPWSSLEFSPEQGHHTEMMTRLER